MPQVERKSYPIAGVKSDDQTGMIEAVVSVFSNVDSGNEKVMPGFFTKSIARKLPKGVWAHDWTQPIAKTLEARELMPGDPMLPGNLKELGGAYIKGQFNLGTQRGREAYSDIKFGIVDEFSIGYKVLKDGKDKESGARELIEGDWKEWSPVLVGMNDQTRLLSIKEAAASAKVTFTTNHDPNHKGMLAEEMAQSVPSVWDLQYAMHRVVKKIAETAKASAVTQVPIDVQAKVSELIAEYAPQLPPLIINQINEFLESSDDEFYLKGTVSESPESFENAVAAIEKHTANLQRNHENRVKDGRVLSAANRAKVQSAYDALGALLSASEVAPKEKSFDVVALRTQHDRVENRLMSLLAQ